MLLYIAQNQILQRDIVTALTPIMFKVYSMSGLHCHSLAMKIYHLSLTGLLGFCLFQKLLLEGCFLFSHCCTACGILVLQPGVKTIPPVVKGKCRVLATGPLAKSLERTFFLLIELPFLFPPVSLSESDALMIPHSCSLLAVITANCNCLLTHVHPPLNSNPRRLARACLGCVCAPLSPDASR